MISLIRTAVLTIAIVLTLSIVVRGKSIFAHIYSFISPATIVVQDTVEDAATSVYQTVSTYSRKLFNNSLPKVKDSVKTRAAALHKDGPPAEEITTQEKQELNQLIKGH